MIDWNELPKFVELVGSCQTLLFNACQNKGSIDQTLVTGAFKCVVAVVCKKMDHADKIQIIGQLDFLSLIESYRMTLISIEIDNVENEDDK